MIFVEICVGSSCHLKGSERIVELFSKYIAERHLENDIVLSGSFCAGKCNRVGVTVTINDEIIPGVTPENFDEFWMTHIQSKLN